MMKVYQAAGGAEGGMGGMGAGGMPDMGASNTAPNNVDDLD